MRLETLKIVGILALALLFTGCQTVTPTDQQFPQLFTKQPQPVWEGNWLAGDPSIISQDGRYLLYYTSLLITGDGDGDNPDNLQVVVSVAESDDGINWRFAAPLTYGESVALENEKDGWDRVLETAFVKKIGEQYLMYYTGYSQEVDGVEKIVADGKIGVARSADALTFARFLDEPVLAADSDFDRDGLFSPSVVVHDGLYYMIYTGWSLDLYGYGLFGATSTDGLTWQKDGRLLIADSDVNWSLDNPREAELVQGPDGLFYLFFTGDIAPNESAIGLARADHPFGPWQLYPDPVLFKTHDWEQSGLIAPAVLIKDNRIRLWYMAETDNFSNFYIGYAEMEFPLDW